MKNFKILKTNILMLMILPAAGFSQQFNPNTPITSIQCSSYTPNNHLDKFIGSWKWTNGNEILEIILKKEKIFNPFKIENGSCEDRLLGFHKYVKNGIVVENTLENVNSTQNQRLYSIYGAFLDNNYNQFVGSFKHKSKNNTMRLKMDYINSTSIKIISFENYEGVKAIFPGDPVPNLTIDLPQNIILTKQ